MMARRPYPWNILEIDPTDDERAIKSAYARKLKLTRPDEDPEGFQALVEARQAAMTRSVRLVAKPATSSKAKKPKRSPRPVEVASSPEQSAAASQTKAADRPVSEPENPAKAIIAFLKSRNPEIVQTGASDVIAKLAQLSFDERETAEQQLIEAAADYVAGHRHVSAHTTLLAENLQRRQIDLILALDKEFGWTDNDRRAASLLYGDAQEFTDQLQILRNPVLEYFTRESTEKVVGWRRWVGYFVLGYFALQVLAAIARFFAP